MIEQTVYDEAGRRVKAADPALYVTTEGDAVVLAQPALNVAARLDAAQALALAAALVRAAARVKGEG